MVETQRLFLCPVQYDGAEDLFPLCGGGRSRERVLIRG
jgi:hypothetical protein